MELIGRDRELDEVVARLRSRRLVTLTGPGGIGKTALARAAVAHERGRFELGSRVVDLTLVDAAERVPGSIAVQLGFASYRSVLESPSEQPVLLLVDNCEHVTAAAADAIDALLAACRSPTVLATSRSPLGLPDESLVVLGPLPLPPEGTVDGDAAAVRLFRERAADAGVVVPGEHDESVVELCRQLDGVPLALEIAAARLRTMTAAEILERVRSRVDVLARPRYRGARRHRSVAETIEWSARLLDDDVAIAFERLGVFAGPFTGDMAHAVVADAAASRLDTDEQLDALVDASLLTVERRDDHTWYRLLGTVRAFALTRLDERGATAATLDRFADHVVARVVAITSGGLSGWGGHLLRDLLGLYENIAAALRWSLDHDDEPGRALLLCSVLWGVVHQAHVDDVAVLAEATVQRWPDPSLPMASDARATLATARYLTGDVHGALHLADEAMPDADAGGPGTFAAITLRRLIAHASHALGDTKRAVDGFQDAAAIARDRGVDSMAMEAEVFRAALIADLGATDEALAVLAEVRRRARAAGAEINEVWAATTEGYVRLRAAPTTALAVIEAALAEARRIDYSAAVLGGLRSRALARVAADRPVEAAGVLLELADELVARGAHWSDQRLLLDVSAVVLHRLGRPAWADLAATARAAPVSSLSSLGHELFPLPDGGGRLLSRREAVACARAELTAVIDDAEADRADVRADEPDADAADDVGGVTTGEAAFVDRGDLWELRFAGRTVHVKASKGLDDLARLLAEPERELHCLELMGAVVDESSTGEALDSTARRQIEQRIRDLQDDIDAAEADHDHGRAEQAHAELDALVDHLAAALGLSGRSRRAGASAERARSAVTQRMRSTIRRIGSMHPELGRHLESSIVTGTFCSYRPEHPVSWRR